MKKYLLLIVLCIFVLIGCGTKQQVKDIIIDDMNCCIDDFDITDYSFKAIYEDGFEEEVKISYDMFSDADKENFNNIGEYDIQLKYKGFKKMFHLILDERKVIRIETSVNNITAYINEFDYKSIVLKLYYNDNTIEEDYLDQSYLDRENFLAIKKAGTHDITITYEEVSTILHIDLLPNEVPIEQLTNDVIIYCKTQKIDDHYRATFYALGNKSFSSFQYLMKVDDNVVKYEILCNNDNIVYYDNEKNLMITYVSPINIQEEIELFTIDFTSSQQYSNFNVKYDFQPKVVYIDNDKVCEVASYIITLAR